MFLSGTVSTFGFSKDILLMPLAIPLILVPAWMYKNTAKLCLIFIFGKKYKKRIKISQQDQDAFR
jgi:hypothetical protein